MGDCYVAVSGLPDPREDHAIAMSKVAKDCLNKMARVTKKLEVKLGPGTTELNIRIGLHRYVYWRPSSRLRRHPLNYQGN